MYTGFASSILLDVVLCCCGPVCLIGVMCFLWLVGMRTGGVPISECASRGLFSLYVGSNFLD